MLGIDDLHSKGLTPLNIFSQAVRNLLGIIVVLCCQLVMLTIKWLLIFSEVDSSPAP